MPSSMILFLLQTPVSFMKLRVSTGTKMQKCVSPNFIHNINIYSNHKYQISFLCPVSFLLLEIGKTSKLVAIKLVHLFVFHSRDSVCDVLLFIEGAAKEEEVAPKVDKRKVHFHSLFQSIQYTLRSCLMTL